LADAFDDLRGVGYVAVLDVIAFVTTTITVKRFDERANVGLKRGLQLQRVGERQRDRTLHDILAEGLAEHGRVTGKVEDVVDDLEREAELPAKGVERSVRGVVTAGAHRFPARIERSASTAHTNRGCIRPRQ